MTNEEKRNFKGIWARLTLISNIFRGVHNLNGLSNDQDFQDFYGRSNLDANVIKPIGNRGSVFVGQIPLNSSHSPHRGTSINNLSKSRRENRPVDFRRCRYLNLDGNGLATARIGIGLRNNNASYRRGRESDRVGRTFGNRERRGECWSGSEGISG